RAGGETARGHASDSCDPRHEHDIVQAALAAPVIHRRATLAPVYRRRVRHTLVVLGLLLCSAGIAHADASAEVTQAFAAFIDGVATNKAPAVDLLITTDSGEKTGKDQQYFAAVPKDLGDARAAIASAKLKAAKVVVSKGGKSA